MTSPAAAVAAACHGVRATMPLDLIAIRTKPHRFWYCCRQPTITPRPFPATIQQQNARRYYAARLYPTKQTPGRVRTAGCRATYREMYRHAFPRFRLPAHLLTPRPPAAAAVDAAAAVVECTQPRRAT